MKDTLPMASAIPLEINEIKLNKIIEYSNLTGLSNNVKWNKLITYMRNSNDWVPSYRYKWINGYISEWDVEWYYHLPFPFKGVLWFDIGYNQNLHIGRLVKDKIIDHSKQLIDIIESIGFVYEKSDDFIRIFGYSPKDYESYNN